MSGGGLAELRELAENAIPLIFEKGRVNRTGGGRGIAGLSIVKGSRACGRKVEVALHDEVM